MSEHHEHHDHLHVTLQIHGMPELVCLASEALRTLVSIKCNQERIMSAISEYTAVVKAGYEAIGANVDAANQSLSGIVGDVANLKDIILKLDTNPGPISPEDQALLDEGKAIVAGLVTKTDAFKTALKELDDATEPAAVPTP